MGGREGGAGGGGVISLRLALGAGALAAAFSGGWLANGWRRDSAELERQNHEAAAARALANRMDRAAEAFEVRQAAADAREAELDRRTYAEVQKPASRGPCLPPDSLRILSDAAADSNAARGLAPALPASAGAH